MERNTTKHIDSAKVLVRLGPDRLSIWPLGYRLCSKWGFFLLKGDLANKYYWFPLQEAVSQCIIWPSHLPSESSDCTIVHSIISTNTTKLYSFVSKWSSFIIIMNEWMCSVVCECSCVYGVCTIECSGTCSGSCLSGTSENSFCLRWDTGQHCTCCSTVVSSLFLPC